MRAGFWNRTGFDAVGGWGRKPTSIKARELSQSSGRPYVSLEDGFIRSVRPGPTEVPLSIVVDHTGTHYDSRTPSDLEALIAARADRAAEARARRAIDRLASEAVSKYNAAPLKSLRSLGFGPRPGAGRVLVIDQTWGDASIAGAQARAETFAEMLTAACVENPGAEIVVKTHPEVCNGRKSGYLCDASGPGVRILSDSINPWPIFAEVDRVYTVSSLLGFEALMAGLPVTCFGGAFYAGWGLTDDRLAIPRRTARPTLEQLFAALYFDYARYVCPRSGEAIEFEDAVDRLIVARDRMVGIGRRPQRRIVPVVPVVPTLAGAEELALA